MPHVHYGDFLGLTCDEDRKCLMQLKSSSHRLNCETGKCVTDKEPTKSDGTKSWYKRCEFCTMEETNWVSHLPFSNIMSNMHLSHVQDIINSARNSTRIPNLSCFEMMNSTISTSSLMSADLVFTSKRSSENVF